MVCDCASFGMIGLRTGMLPSQSAYVVSHLGPFQRKVSMKQDEKKLRMMIALCDVAAACVATLAGHVDAPINLKFRGDIDMLGTNPLLHSIKRQESILPRLSPWMESTKSTGYLTPREHYVNLEAIE